VHKISVIVPTYNEKENLGRLVERVFEALKGVDFEIVVVDDNSPDGTGQLADQIALKNSNVKAVHRPGKLGLGTAILDGVKASEGEFVSVIDADLQHPPELLKVMLEKAVEGNDVVIASRYVEGGRVEGWSFTRRLISKGALWLSHILLPRTRGVKDTLSGYFVFKKDVIGGVQFNARGFKLLIEILVKGKYNKVVEVPYTFKPREVGESKMKLNEIFNYLRQVIRLSNYRAFKFMAVGVSGVFVNLGALWYLKSFIGISELVAGALAIELSILSNFLLNDFWTFRDRRRGRFVHRLIKCHGSAIGPLVNFVTLVVLVWVGVHYLVSDAIGILLGFAANYLFSETVIWS